MSQTTLYRKYRPKNFSEVIGQGHIVRTLTNAIKHNRIGQAYLFTGPRGTGKTSIARILAKAINCTQAKDAISCEKCEACQLISEGKALDIIEIDAASNTGVDNIRELRETISLPSTILKYKVYIIDEVHMLSTGAFNALLKTLEEPPAHVVFILATTEIHKVPETIISRCQRFDFSRLPMEEIIEKLSLIAKAEKVKISKAALEMIAISSEGGMRDAESLLGQIIALEDKEITAKEVEEILGTTDRKISRDVAQMIIEDKTTEAISEVNTLLNDGYDLEIFNKSLINYFRQLMLLKVNSELQNYFSYEMTKEQVKEMLTLVEKAELSKIVNAINLLLEAQNKISSSILSQLPLEIAIIRATQTLPTVNKEQETGNKRQETRDKRQATGDKQQLKVQTPVVSSSRENTATKNIEVEKIKDINHPVDSNIASEVNEESEDVTSDLPEGSLEFYDVKQKWPELLIEIQPVNHSLKALLCNCQLMEVEGCELTLGTPYEFYLEKLNDPKNRLTIEEVFGKILGCKVKIKGTVDKSLVLSKPENNSCSTEETNHQQESLLSSAMEIMGGTVVQE